MSNVDRTISAAALRTRLKTFGRPLLFILVFVLAVWSIWILELHQTDFSGGADGLTFLYGAAIPPEMSVLEVGLRGLLETLYIAYVGTLFGVLLSLPVSLVASRNLFPWYLTLPARWFLAVLRVLPSILWAVIFVILIGTGPAAGVFAITLYTIGFIGKLEYEAFEGLDNEPIEAVSSLGATRLQILRFVVLPQAINSLISQTMFMFEYNVRHAAAIGIVGAGGIGYYIMGYLDFLQYDRVIVLLAIVFLAVLVIDELSYRLRSFFLGDTSTSLSK
ncbi:phosphonate ABC transporter, permease protein PhnE [Natronococcus occultus]|uniref:Phosphonate ABC transporter, permease protein PhnE n=1 Tax=Natronococcus occultus SP4 TaxID=694430 RepID=L0K5V2_9EURY|nr:phosphonate ABC transporter, permease protein PhnE [Natronococcus occultus]AGB39905.1 phosphonate ABC transporter, permease protein PhnE [Natronococcus occultus SP4]